MQKLYHHSNYLLYGKTLIFWCLIITTELWTIFKLLLVKIIMIRILIADMEKIIRWAFIRSFYTLRFYTLGSFIRCGVIRSDVICWEALYVGKLYECWCYTFRCCTISRWILGPIRPKAFHFAKLFWRQRVDALFYFEIYFLSSFCSTYFPNILLFLILIWREVGIGINDANSSTQVKKKATWKNKCRKGR
jgi:hypothetical protein